MPEGALAQPESLSPRSEAPDTQETHARARRKYWDDFALESDSWRGAQGYYHERLAEIYRNIIPRGARVLEIGCGSGDLLAALQPVQGVGIDFSPAMISRARMRHPHLLFVEADALEMEIAGEFEYIVLSDLVNDLWDVQGVLDQVRKHTTQSTRVVVNCFSMLWHTPLGAASRMHLARPTLRQNWLTVQDIRGFLKLSDFETVRSWRELLFPLHIPLVSGIANRFLAHLWPVHNLAMVNFFMARPVSQTAMVDPLSVSVVVPARNEARNIKSLLERMPQMGSNTEIIFVEGHSNDDTYETIATLIAQEPPGRCRLYRQSGEGKGDAVRTGFAKAQGEILMILDADLTVAPEDLPRFYDALVSGAGEFINGVRLVYPMEPSAMRSLNLVGNKFFSAAFTWLLGQSIRDTLCGTKALRRSDYDKITANRAYFGDFDPFGDFDLLFGAAKLNLAIAEVPIRYHQRVYGQTNIARWRHGWLLLKMMGVAARRIKLV